MSASKNKLIDKANEEAKKPKKVRAKRVAAPEPVIPVTIASTVQLAQPQLTQEQIDALYAEFKAKEDAEQTVATISINEADKEKHIAQLDEIQKNLAAMQHIATDEREHTEPTKPNLLTRLKKSWIFWAVSAILLGGVIALIAHGGHKGKADKKTVQIEKSIEAQKAQLSKAEVMLNEMASRRTDSAINEVSQLMSEAVSYQKAWVNTMQRMNDIQKEQNEKLQERIRIANDDTLRKIGSQLSGQ